MLETHTLYSLFLLNLLLIIQGIFIRISKNSLLPKIVKEEELSWANNTIFLVILFVGVVSPFIASLLLTVSEKIPFILDAATYFIEAVIVVSIVVTGVLMDVIGIRPIFNGIALLLLLLFLGLFHTRKFEEGLEE